MSNPFAYGRIVRNADYCARPDLEQMLASNIESSHNTAVLGARRTGKTSLIVQTVGAMPEVRLMRVNMLAVKGVSDVGRRLLTGMLSLQGDDTLWGKTMRALGHLRPSVSLDPGSGALSVTLDSIESRKPESIEGILEAIGSLHDSRPIAVLIDEFQDVARMQDGEQIVALMRGVIQFQSNLPYIFAGSDQHGMHMLFLDPDSAFYKSAHLLPVGPIEREHFRRHLQALFARGERVVSDDLWEEVFRFTSEVAGDVQQMCHALWESSSPGEILGRDRMNGAIEQVIFKDLMGFETLLDTISERQMGVLRAVVLRGGEHPYAEEFLQDVGTRQTATVRVALEGLVKKRILVRQGRSYRTYSPFFAAWLLREGF